MNSKRSEKDSLAILVPLGDQAVNGKHSYPADDQCNADGDHEQMVLVTLAFLVVDPSLLLSVGQIPKEGRRLDEPPLFQSVESRP